MIDLKHVLVGFVISHVDDGVAREVCAFALQGQVLVRGIRHEHIDDHLPADESHVLERSCNYLRELERDSARSAMTPSSRV